MRRIKERVSSAAQIHADEASHWDALHGLYDIKRINHQVAYSQRGACTNWAESFFARMRLMVRGSTIMSARTGYTRTLLMPPGWRITVVSKTVSGQARAQPRHGAPGFSGMEGILAAPSIGRSRKLGLRRWHAAADAILALYLRHADVSG